jgi:hypothetical protein
VLGRTQQYINIPSTHLTSSLHDHHLIIKSNQGVHHALLRLCGCVSKIAGLMLHVLLGGL